MFYGMKCIGHLFVWYYNVEREIVFDCLRALSATHHSHH